MLVAHPAYWQRGHCSKLTKWALQLAGREKVEVGVVATRMGVRFFKKIGFVLDE
jgi:hypothetical protein